MKFLLNTYSAAGHVNPMQTLAAELVKRGHEVVWLTGYDSERKVVEVGARFVRLKALEPFDETMRTEDKPPLTTGQLVKAIVENRTVAQAADFRMVLKDFKADCVVNELNVSGAQCLHELGEIPTYASLGVFPLWQGGMDLPPPFSGGHPPTTLWERIMNRIKVLWTGLVLLPIFVYPTVQAQRKQMGLAPLPWSILADQVARSSQLHIHTSCPTMEYFHDDRAYEQVHFVGPFIPPDASGGEFHNAPSWWPDVQSHPCVIHVTQGTYTMNPLALILPTLQALGDNKDYLLVVTSPLKDTLMEAMKVLPSNVRIASFLPYDLLLPYVKLLVTNGGYGGVKQALINGIPIVCAGQTEDKMDCAARVTWNKAGVDLKTDTPTAQQVAKAVSTVLGDSTYRENAQRLAKELKSYGGVQKACDLLEELVKTKDVVRRTDAEKLPPWPRPTSF